MPNRSLSKQEIQNINESFKRLKSISLVQKELGYNYRTVVKYLVNKSLPLPKRCSVERIIEIYNLTGSLNRVASILNTNKTSVWRMLKRNNISLCKGTASWKRLYNTLRRRVSKSDWRKQVIAKCNARCVKCLEPSNVVHHLYKLSQIRDEVIKAHPEISPFRSFVELRKFTDLVMELHKIEDGVVLCKDCHELEHTKKL